MLAHKCDLKVWKPPNRPSERSAAIWKRRRRLDFSKKKVKCDWRSRHPPELRTCASTRYRRRLSSAGGWGEWAGEAAVGRAGSQRCKLGLSGPERRRYTGRMRSAGGRSLGSIRRRRGSLECLGERFEVLHGVTECRVGHPLPQFAGQFATTHHQRGSDFIARLGKHREL